MRYGVIVGGRHGLLAGIAAALEAAALESGQPPAKTTGAVRVDLRTGDSARTTRAFERGYNGTGGFADHPLPTGRGGIGGGPQHEAEVQASMCATAKSTGNMVADAQALLAEISGAQERLREAYAALKGTASILANSCPDHSAEAAADLERITFHVRRNAKVVLDRIIKT